MAGNRLQKIVDFWAPPPVAQEREARAGDDVSSRQQCGHGVLSLCL